MSRLSVGLTSGWVALTPWALRASNQQLVYQVHIGVGISDAGYVSGQLADGAGFVFSLQTNQLRVLPVPVMWTLPAKISGPATQ